jgi:hypothetical protein
MNKNKIIVEFFSIRFFCESIRKFNKNISNEKKKSVIVEKKICGLTKNVRFIFISLFIALAFILFFMALLVDIRNLKRI